MILEHDLFHEMQEPEYVLCKSNGDRLGVIRCTKKQFRKKYNDYNELSFTVFRMYDNEPDVLYESICEMQYVEIPHVGRFLIDKITLRGESPEYEYKECSAVSEETAMAQKYLETFFINLGTTGSIDGVSLYNPSQPKKSLMHLVLEKCPDWSLGSVDVSLREKQRSFNISRQDIYSFLMNDVSEAFDCVFSFDTLHHKINISSGDTAGTDTGIMISYDNLLQNVSVSSSIDNIKTCLTITGSDDLNIREINMGYDRIYLLDYFHSPEFMSDALYRDYGIWKDKWNTLSAAYEPLAAQYQAYYQQIHFLKNEKMPQNPESTDWIDYGLVPLEEQLSIYEKKLDVMIKAGHGNPEHAAYKTTYLPCYRTIQDLKHQIAAVKTEIEQLQNSQASLSEQIDELISAASMEHNFTGEELAELTKFIREEELSSSNFVVTDSMTESQRIDMLHELLSYGQKELAKLAQPSLTFSASILNLYNIPEFASYCESFDTGNYIHVLLRDDYIIQARILEIDFNFSEKSISPTFGTLSRSRTDGILSDVTNTLSLAQSAASSVSFGASHWNRANEESSLISQMLSKGLLSAGQTLKTSRSDLMIDDRGIFLHNAESSAYPKDAIFLGGGQILFTDDDFSSVKTALGRVSYRKDGIEYSDFGLLAQFVISGYIAGSTIEGNEILGGSITGTEFSNGNGTFTVDEAGYVTAKSGSIGGWTITANKIYGGDPSQNEKVAVMQRPKDNISYVFAAGGSSHNSYADCPFRVTKEGKLYAEDASISGSITVTSGTFGGIHIANDRIYSDNHNFSISSSGQAEFKDVRISGVSSGSSFGGVTYSESGTFGTFSNGFSADTSFQLNGTAKTDFNQLVAQTVTAEYIKATVGLSATNADIESLTARVANIENITAGTVVAENLKVHAANILGPITSVDFRLINQNDGSITQITEPIDIFVISQRNSDGTFITKKVRVLGVEVQDGSSI